MGSDSSKCPQTPSSNYDLQVVQIGNSDTNVKSVDNVNVIKCISDYKAPGFDDTFNINVSDGKILVKRTDDGGGWGQDLSIPCSVKK